MKEQSNAEFVAEAREYLTPNRQSGRSGLALFREALDRLEALQAEKDRGGRRIAKEDAEYIERQGAVIRELERKLEEAERKLESERAAKMREIDAAVAYSNRCKWWAEQHAELKRLVREHRAAKQRLHTVRGELRMARKDPELRAEREALFHKIRGLEHEMNQQLEEASK